MRRVIILVTGDRNWNCTSVASRMMRRFIARYGVEGFELLHGNAPGVDTAFDFAAEVRGVKRKPIDASWDDLTHPQAVIRHHPDGRAYNANAGPIRNQELVNAGPDFCVAVHRNIRRSKGTKDCVKKCFAAGIRVFLVESNDAEPREIFSV